MCPQPEDVYSCTDVDKRISSRAKGRVWPLRVEGNEATEYSESRVTEPGFREKEESVSHEGKGLGKWWLTSAFWKSLWMLTGLLGARDKLGWGETTRAEIWSHWMRLDLLRVCRGKSHEVTSGRWVTDKRDRPVCTLVVYAWHVSTHLTPSLSSLNGQTY